MTATAFRLPNFPARDIRHPGNLRGRCRCGVLNCGNSGGGRCRVDVTVPDADREAVAAGVVDADAHASPPAPAALAPPHAAQSSAAPQVLPSARLVRLAELAAAALDPEAVAV